jgi:hypothetical protein
MSGSNATRNGTNGGTGDFGGAVDVLGWADHHGLPHQLRLVSDENRDIETVLS